MDATAVTSATAVQPLSISIADYVEIATLQKIVSNTLPNAQVTPARAKTLLDTKLTNLNLPTLPIEYVAWMEPIVEGLEEMKCVCFSFFVSSLPSPQQLWKVPLPESLTLPVNIEEIARDNVLKAHLSSLFSSPCVISSSQNEAYGFKAHNWEQPLQTLQSVNLREKGKSLAQEWLSALQNSTPDSQAYNNHFENLSMLLCTLADRKICFFTEEEFAPFIKTMALKNDTLSQWRAVKFVRPKS